MRVEGFSREGPIYENIHAPLRHAHAHTDTSASSAGGFVVFELLFFFMVADI